MDAGTSLTVTLVRRALALRREDLPDDVVRIVRQTLLDTLGVTLAGASDPLPRRLCEDAVAEGGRGLARVIGGRERLGLRPAALVNGAAAHALDFDDVNLQINGHPSAVLWPAVLAVADAHDCSGAETFMGFVTGYEFACRVGMVVEPGHYDRGYHATSSVGILGAALACARLLKLDEAQALHAVGIAATMASGLKAMFGTPCKPLHAGLAARNGLEAALWAQQGLTSRPDILECTRGFARTLSPDFREQDALADPGRFLMRENLFKYHAACYGTHSAIEAALALRRHGVQPQDVERIRIRVEKVADTTCNIPDPRTGAEAKFSLRLATAMALLGLDTGDLDLYAPATIERPDVQRLRAAAVVELVDGWSTMDSEVIVTLRDGRELSERVDTGVPCQDLTWQGERVAVKFQTLTRPLVGDAGSRALAEAVEGIEAQPARRLLDLCEVGHA
ncbi:MAG TPA: MmgE/PrpD family protein [Ramlibacter sp.]|nr:MmgE/PrpD family protein [Ramlibacter sp.]